MRAPAPPLAVPLARRRPSRPWAALLVSAVLHLLLAAAIVVRAVPEETEGQPGEEARPAEPAREVRMVYVPPAPEPTPLPPPPPPPPAPRQRPEEVALGPDSDRPDEPPRDAARDPRDDEPTGRPDGELDPERQAPAAAAPRRIQTAAESFSRFSGLANLLGLGRRPQAERQEEFDGPAEQRSLGDALTLGAPRLGPSELDERRWTSSNPSAAGQCPEIPDLGLNEDGTPVLASVVGRILSRNGTSPLEGAHLQIVGTAFTTFTDARGEYVIRFDPKLLQRCRTQYVQVSAPGHRPELLILVIGRKIRSDDVLMRRR